MATMSARGRSPPCLIPLRISTERLLFESLPLREVWSLASAE
jgi:hypothetical protein